MTTSSSCDLFAQTTCLSTASRCSDVSDAGSAVVPANINIYGSGNPRAALEVCERKRKKNHGELSSPDFLFHFSAKSSSLEFSSHYTKRAEGDPLSDLAVSFWSCVLMETLLNCPADSEMTELLQR